MAAGDIFNDFDKWQDEQLWPVIGGGKEVEGDSGIDLEIDTSSRRSTLRQDVKEAIVLSNELLTAEGEPEKRHIVLKLPTGMSYKAGDYLAVLPLNNMKIIRRVLKRFGLPWDAILTIKTGANTTLPTEHPLSAMDILGAYVELSQPATRRVRFLSIKSQHYLFNQLSIPLSQLLITDKSIEHPQNSRHHPRLSRTRETSPPRWPRLRHRSSL